MKNKFNLNPNYVFAELSPVSKDATLEDIFVEEPVPLDVFVGDSFYLNYKDTPLSPIQFDLVQHMERIFFEETYALMAREWEYWRQPSVLTNKPVRTTNLLTAQWGKSGGKDMTVRVGYLRVAYLLQCLRNPQGYYGMPGSESIHMLNVAVNAHQANNVFFRPIPSIVRKGWWADKCEATKSEIVFDKNVIALSGHSQAESQEGMNLIFSVIDEVDGFASKADITRTSQRMESNTVEYLMEMTRTSGSTRFPAVYKQVRISYPRYLGSVIQQLTDEAKDDIEVLGAESRHYVSGPHATWDVNPLRSYEDFKHEYEGPKAKPEEAAAKYECKPARSLNTYFNNMEAFRISMRGTQPISIDYELKKYKSALTEKIVEAWNPVYHFAPDFKPKQGAIYAIHVDLAVTGDRAGIAMSHVKEWQEYEETLYDEEQGEFLKVTSRPIVENDFCIAFTAAPKDIPRGLIARDIQVRWARELVTELIRQGFAVSRVTYDGFQSVDSIQILNAQGVETDKKSTDRAGSEFWKTLKDVAYENRLIMPFSQLLLNELESLGEIKNKIDHPPHGSKDLADAFAVSVAMAIDLGGREVDEIAYPQTEVIFARYENYTPLAGIELELPSSSALSWW